MPKKKRSSRSKGLPVRVKLLVALLVALSVGGIALVKFLQTPKGHAVLLDRGFGDYYSQVQQSLDTELRTAMRYLGLEKRLTVATNPIDVRGKRAVRREWTLRLEKPRSLIRINVSLTEAVERAGGFVRSSKEIRGGDRLVLEVGSRKYSTHRIEIRQALRPALEKRPTAHVARIALVIDDFGYSRSAIVEAFLRVKLPLTLSVIPTLPHTRYCLSRAREEHKETILHLPMEAEEVLSDVKPVVTTMSAQDIEALVEQYLSETLGVVGANNHLGSVATQNEQVIKSVLGVVKAHKLFFLDSLTSNKSVAYNTARSVGVPSARNDLFIDADTEEQGVVEARLERLREIAETRGFAIGIGHPRPWTFDAIEAFGDRLKGSGVELVFVSELVE